MSRPSGPRIRSFKPERYHDERMAGVTRDARHLYDGLTVRADDEGRGTANPALLRADLLPFDDDATPDRVSAWLAELELGGLVQLYVVDGRDYYALPSWPSDQRIDKPTPSRHPAPPDASPRDSSEIPREESRGNAAGPREIVEEADIPQSRAETEVPREESRGIASAPPRARRGADHDLDQDQDQDHSSSAGAAEPDRPEITSLCELLAELILANDPKAKVNPASKGWRAECRLLLDKDDRTVDEIEQVIRWTQADPFERSNVQSMEKLRKRFSPLWLKSVPTGAQSSSPSTRPLDGVSARRADAFRQMTGAAA